MTDLQKRLFDLAIRYEALGKERKQVRAELDVVMAQLGVGTYHQDSDMTVYKIVEPTGTFVEYHKIGYDRTAKVDESRGTLSKKEAEENGFTVLKKA